MATVLETFGVVRADGTLELKQKLAVPPGRVRVRVESMEAPVTEPAAESADDLAKRFQRLAETWRHDCRFSSKVKTVAEHPAYREIIAMGDKAVPLILADLEKEADHWFIALHKITGAHPVPKEDAGRIEKISAAWITWGRQQGYRW